MSQSYGLAMDSDDIGFLPAYFRDTEHRDPTITEIRMIDTYWSDHCRHTTFSTNIDNVYYCRIRKLKQTYREYLIPVRNSIAEERTSRSL